MLLRPVVILASLALTMASPAPQGPAVPGAGALEDAQRLFYNARYDAAAARTLDFCDAVPVDLAACELRSTALLFQVRRAIGEPKDKAAALKRCAECPALIAAFQAAVVLGRAGARAGLKTRPDDDATLFLLGKLDLNHVWLHLGTLGRKTGWGEYWEARNSLDAVIKHNPAHVRARVARAWIDYIVDTKMPRGTRWLLGGGNKKRGLLAVREAAGAQADFFVRAEARFALWDMQVRERNFPDAVTTARSLAEDFPENPELSLFLKTHDHASPQNASKQ